MDCGAWLVLRAHRDICTNHAVYPDQNNKYGFSCMPPAVPAPAAARPFPARFAPLFFQPQRLRTTLCFLHLRTLLSLKFFLFAVFPYFTKNPAVDIL
jgi:hypothetical protein